MKQIDLEKDLGEKQVVGIFETFSRKCSNLNLFSEHINIKKLVDAPKLKLVFGK